MLISKNFKKFSILNLDKLRILFFLLINTIMPTFIGILTFMRGGGEFHAQAELSMNLFLITSGPDCKILTDARY